MNTDAALLLQSSPSTSDKPVSDQGCHQIQFGAHPHGLQVSRSEMLAVSLWPRSNVLTASNALNWILGELYTIEHGLSVSFYQGKAP